MLIDEVSFTIKAGNGGDGFVHFYRDRWRPKGGPDGGDGGDGGHVYFKAVSDINRLQQFRHTKKYLAENGQKGGRNQCTGHAGVDLILEVPVGSLIEYDNGTSVELTEVDQIYHAARGGKGGVGNYRFRSATNQTPQQFKPGFVTQPKSIHIQLKLIADVGLIGLPNTGKSSLLNELTSAHAKVANYAFTTLEPNLGSMLGNKIIADIPGLIEGASLGKGLGYKFLRHIERTRLLLHCLSAESPTLPADYQAVRQELENYSSVLAKKKEIVIITKSDLVTDPKMLKKLISSTHATMSVSAFDYDSISRLQKLLIAELS